MRFSTTSTPTDPAAGPAHTAPLVHSPAISNDKLQVSASVVAMETQQVWKTVQAR